MYEYRFQGNSMKLIRLINAIYPRRKNMVRHSIWMHSSTLNSKYTRTRVYLHKQHSIYNMFCTPYNTTIYSIGYLEQRANETQTISILFHFISSMNIESTLMRYIIACHIISENDKYTLHFSAVLQFTSFTFTYCV